MPAPPGARRARCPGRDLVRTRSRVQASGGAGVEQDRSGTPPADRSARNGGSRAAKLHRRRLRLLLRGQGQPRHTPRDALPAKPQAGGTARHRARRGEGRSAPSRAHGRCGKIPCSAMMKVTVRNGGLVVVGGRLLPAGVRRPAGACVGPRPGQPRRPAARPPDRAARAAQTAPVGSSGSRELALALMPWPCAGISVCSKVTFSFRSGLSERRDPDPGPCQGVHCFWRLGSANVVWPVTAVFVPEEREEGGVLGDRQDLAVALGPSVGAKFPANILISARNGVDVGRCSPVR